MMRAPLSGAIGRVMPASEEQSTGTLYHGMSYSLTEQPELNIIFSVLAYPGLTYRKKRKQVKSSDEGFLEQNEEICSFFP